MFSFEHTEVAWAAGFYDGEGTIYYCAQTSKGHGVYYKSIQLQVSQHADNPWVIDRFQAAIGGIGKISTNPNGKGKQTRCRVTNFHHAQFVIALLWRYLSPVKRRQAKEALSTYLNDNSGTHKRAAILLPTTDKGWRELNEEEEYAKYLKMQARQRKAE